MVDSSDIASGGIAAAAPTVGAVRRRSAGVGRAFPNCHRPCQQFNTSINHRSAVVVLLLDGRQLAYLQLCAAAGTRLTPQTRANLMRSHRINRQITRRRDKTLPACAAYSWFKSLAQLPCVSTRPLSRRRPLPMTKNTLSSTHRAEADGAIAAFILIIGRIYGNDVYESAANTARQKRRIVTFTHK